MASVKPICRIDKINKSGTAPIKIRIIENRKPREISIGQRIEPKHWDHDSGRAKGSHPNSNRLNQLIVQKEAEYLDLAIDIDSGKTSLKDQGIKEALADGAETNFFEYIDGVIENFEAGEQFGYAGDFRSGRRRLWLFCEFLKWPTLTFGDFSRLIKYKKLKNELLFMDAFEKFQVQELKLSMSSVYGSYLKVSRVFKLAIRARILDAKYDPTKNYSVPAPKGRRKFLTPEQLSSFIKLCVPDVGLAVLAKDMYLFCALGGGLRFGDCARLKWANIYDRRLDVNTKKTNTPIWFELGELPMQILEKYKTPLSRNDDFIFPVLSPTYHQMGAKEKFRHIKNKNHEINRKLRLHAPEIGVVHTMSFHTSRHTFATLAVRMGMKITSLQKILGHKEIATTEKYWHVLGIDLEEDIEKFNQKIRVNSLFGGKNSEGQQEHGKIGLVRLYIDQMTRVRGGELSILCEDLDIISRDLDQYMEELVMPENMRKVSIIRILYSGKGDYEEFQKAINEHSLFGEEIVFKLVPKWES